MEPIISPWMIYFIGIADSIRQTSNMLAFISSLCCIVSLGFYTFHVVNMPYIIDDKEREAYTKLVKASKLASKFLGILFVTTLLLSVFVPNKQMLISMAVANIVTPENIQGANDFVKTNVQDYINMIVDGINKVK